MSSPPPLPSPTSSNFPTTVSFNRATSFAKSAAGTGETINTSALQEHYSQHVRRFVGSQHKLMLHVFIGEAVNLLSADPNGFSDPYLKIKVDNAVDPKVKTETIHKNLNPVYNKEFTFVLKSGVLEGNNINIEAMDYDMLNSDDSLGFATIPLSSFDMTTGAFAGWLTFRRKQDSPKLNPGRLYVRAILDKDRSALLKSDKPLFEAIRESLLESTLRWFHETVTRLGDPRLALPNLGMPPMGNPAPGHAAIRVFCGSWNVGNEPTSDSATLRHWLKPGAHVYVIGTQENTYQPRKPYKTHLADFEAHVGEALGEEYELMQSESMGQIHIHVYGHTSLRGLMDVVQPAKAFEATGIANVGTNKGGTCVAVYVAGTSIAFISSHLAAHTTMLERRNSDMGEIAEGISFKGMRDAGILHSFHHIVWMGDLNYRLMWAGDEKTPDPEKFKEMLQMIEDKRFGELFFTDQLSAAIAKDEAFSGFNDCVPNFKPTFKVDRGVVEPAYHDKRAPSYCDRVLWRSQAGFDDQLKLINFTSTNEVISSDHKPVAAVFQLYAPVREPALDAARGSATLVLHSIKASGLPVADMNGLSDPFIKFFSPWVNSGVSIRTPVKQKTLNPVWEKHELPVLPLNVNNPDRLHQCFIPFKVSDMDVTSYEFLCSGVLSLAESNLWGTGATTDAHIVLRDKGGLPAGAVTITYSIEFGYKVAPAPLPAIMKIQAYRGEAISTIAE